MIVMMISSRSLTLLTTLLAGFLHQSYAGDTSIWELSVPLPPSGLDPDPSILGRTTKEVTTSEKNPSWSPASSSNRKLSAFSLFLESSSPTTGCEDTTLSFMIGTKKRDCGWAAKGNTKDKCGKGKKRSVSSLCPVTCGMCHKRACRNPLIDFLVEKPDGAIISRDCSWVKEHKKARCAIPGVASACRKFCNPICKFPRLQNTGVCTDSDPCSECEGICNTDGDCNGTMRCMRRSGGDNVPGCRWSGVELNKDFQKDSNFCEYIRLCW